MSWIERAAWVVGMVVFMECFAWGTHRYVMHGRLGWGWHRSHHEPHDELYEKNDLYAVVFSVIVTAMFTVGIWYERVWWAALGVTVYGLIYFFVHDMLVHQRFGFRWVPKKGYAKRLLQAHRLHHAVKGRDGTVSHGFLLAPSPARLKAQLRAGEGQTRMADASDAR